jgi:putative DNA primase/helicase
MKKKDNPSNVQKGQIPPSNLFYNLMEETLSDISYRDIQAEAQKLLQEFKAIPHSEVLSQLLGQIGAADFRELAGISDANERLRKKHFLICCVEKILHIALENNWGICRRYDFIYLYNGAYWRQIEVPELQTFLGAAAEKLGIDKFDARLYSFREQLYRQFLSASHLPAPDNSKGPVLINLKNGTFEIGTYHQKLRAPNPADFITYQLPFTYDPHASAPIFQEYLNKVQPDPARQLILAEYIGYLFIRAKTMKLEKTLLLYGTGANGKSVFFDVINALLGGNANVSNYSLQNLTNENGYYRAMIANKLVNYASEINGKLEAAIFKQLVSGEPVEARMPYGLPFTLTDYAKLIFNCNELPKEVEQSHAFFRRFLIIPFEVTIPESEQDKQLSQKIIQQELSGVFNWVLAGLQRLLKQRNFTWCEAVENQVSIYKRQSDSVQMFLDEEGYEISITDHQPLKDLFQQYRTYCLESGFHSCSLKTFTERLRHLGFVVERKNYGNAVNITRSNGHE